MKTVIGKVVGIPTAAAWAQVVAIKPEAVPQRVRDNPFLAAISLETQGDLEAAVVGKEVLGNLEEEFFGKDQEAVFEALGRSCQAGLGKIEASLGEGMEVEFNLVAASLEGEVLSLTQIGEGQVWLWRQGQLGPILNQPSEKLKRSSGKIQPGDILILATPLFWEKITEGELKAALAGGEPEEAVDGLTPKIHGLEKAALVAALFVKFEEEKLSAWEEEDVLGEKTEPETEDLPQERKPRLPGQKWEEIFKKRSRERPIFVRGPEAEVKRKKRILLAAIFFGFLFLLSIVKGVSRKGFLGRRASFQELVAQIQDKIAAAEDFSSLNPKKASELLAEAEALLEEMRALKVNPDQIKELEEEIKNKRKEILLIQEIEPDLIFDLSLIKSQVEGVSLSWVEDRVLVLSSGSIFSVDPQEKKGEMVLAGDDLTSGLFLDDLFVFTKSGAFKLDLEDETLAKVVEPEENWDGIKGFSTYMENLYLLDTAAGQIKKYLATGSGYLAPQDYLEEPGDFTKGTDLTIDGLVYVLKEDGTVLKYLQGTKEFFQVSGLDRELGRTTVCYTNPEVDNFYILDQENKRIVVLEKTGEYKAQYVAEVLGEARDFVVDQERKKIYVLVGSRVYGIGI